MRGFALVARIRITPNVRPQHERIGILVEYRLTHTSQRLSTLSFLYLALSGLGLPVTVMSPLGLMDHRWALEAQTITLHHTLGSAGKTDRLKATFPHKPYSYKNFFYRTNSHQGSPGLPVTEIIRSLHKHTNR